MTAKRRDFLGTVAAAAAGSFLPVGATRPAEAKFVETGDRALPKFRLGLVTYNMAAKWDLPTILRICKGVGIGPVELRTTHAHGVEPSLSKDARKDVRQRFADAGVEFWGCGSTCDFHAVEQRRVHEQIETCKRFVDLVADLGGKGVKVRPNGLPPEVPVEKTLEQIGKSLIECGKAGESAGVEIWVEVHGKGTQQPDNMRKIMEHCGHPKVGICWNSNPTDLVGKSVEPSFRMLWPWIRSCHINDLYKDMRGQYPYRELFRLLRESGYDRATLIEVGKTPPDAAVGEELLRYYRALWQELASGQ